MRMRRQNLCQAMMLCTKWYLFCWMNTFRQMEISSCTAQAEDWRLRASQNSTRPWKFLGVDPAEPMLDEARKRLEPIKDRVSLHRGFIFDAPDIELDAATSLLTLHFLYRDDRQETVTEIVRRLKPGAPFIAVHCSFPQGEKNMWLSRHRCYSIASGIDPEMAEAGRVNIEAELPVLNPEEDVAILNAAGLKNVRQFYSAFTWRGWVGYA